MSNVTITAILCGERIRETPQVYYGPPDLSTKVVKNATKYENGILTYNMDVSPGLYIMSISSKDDACAWMAVVPVLAGHTRNIAAYVAPEPLPEDHTNCALAGTLPYKGLTVSLVVPKGTVIRDTVVGPNFTFTLPEENVWPATIDDGAYYFDRIWPVRYKLRIEAGTSYAYIPVDLTVLQKGLEPCNKMMQVDISADVFRSGS